ncbi:hypothetical protein ACLOJK_026587 [Asimina triloba]
MAASLFSKQIQNNSSGIMSQIARLFSSKSNPPYIVKAGIPEFLTSVGRGVESHIPKLEEEIGELHKLLVTRTLRLKKLGIPCKHSLLPAVYEFRIRLLRAKRQHVFIKYKDRSIR